MSCRFAFSLSTCRSKCKRHKKWHEDVHFIWFPSIFSFPSPSEDLSRREPLILQGDYRKKRLQDPFIMIFSFNWILMKCFSHRRKCISALLSPSSYLSLFAMRFPLSDELFSRTLLRVLLRCCDERLIPAGENATQWNLHEVCLSG